MTKSAKLSMTWGDQGIGAGDLDWWTEMLWENGRLELTDWQDVIDLDTGSLRIRPDELEIVRLRTRSGGADLRWEGAVRGDRVFWERPEVSLRVQGETTVPGLVRLLNLQGANTEALQDVNWILQVDLSWEGKVGRPDLAIWDAKIGERDVSFEMPTRGDPATVGDLDFDAELNNNFVRIENLHALIEDITLNDVPVDLERIVRKCLEKDAARRYQSAHELLVDLSHLRGDGSGTSIPVAAPSPVRSSHQYWAAALAAVAASAALGAGGAVWMMLERLDVIDSIAVVPRVDASSPTEAGDLARDIAKGLVNSLTQLPNVSVAPRETAFAAGASTNDPFAIAEQLGVHGLLFIRDEPGRQSAALDLQLPTRWQGQGQRHRQ